MSAARQKLATADSCRMTSMGRKRSNRFWKERARMQKFNPVGPTSRTDPKTTSILRAMAGPAAPPYRDWRCDRLATTARIASLFQLRPSPGALSSSGPVSFRVAPFLRTEAMEPRMEWNKIEQRSPDRCTASALSTYGINR